MNRKASTPTSFAHPVGFWLSVTACSVGVLLHFRMYLQSRDMGYHMAGMSPDLPMMIGMALIVAGLAGALWALMPKNARDIGLTARRIEVRVIDDMPVRLSHVLLVAVMTLALTIDVMKPTTLGFVAPGVAREYGLRSPANPHGTIPVTLLPLAGILGTLIGSLIWGWIGDRIGRRSSIMYAGILFVSTAICGAMPGFRWNLVMCLIMGLAAGGMLPIGLTLIAEIIPVRHRGWVVVLVGGDIAGAYVITSWLAGALTPTYSWRILWLVGLPTGLLLLLLNRWIPESPRYLLARGYDDAAAEVMARFGATTVVRIEQQASHPVSEARGQAGYSALLRQPFRRTSSAIVCLALAVGLLTYGFQFWVPSGLQHAGLMAVNADYILRDSALYGLPVTVVTALLYGFWSSRGTIGLLAVLTGLSVVLFAWAQASGVTGHSALVFLLVMPLSGISSLAAVVAAFSTEVYPTLMRSRGAGLAAGMTKAGGVLILLVLVAWAWTPSLQAAALIGAVPLLGAAAIFMYSTPETRQRRLEDIAPAFRPMVGADD